MFQTRLGLVACAVLTLTQPGIAISQDDPRHLVDLAERFCFGPDGDHEWTWAVAANEEYEPLEPSDFSDLRTPGARQVRGFSKTTAGTEVRVLTAVDRFAYGPARLEPAVNFHLCWVSSRSASRANVDDAIKNLFGVRRFRQKRAFVYPWTPGPDNTRLSVRRSDFTDRFVETARDQGMRMVMTNEAGGWVSITYMRPVDSCQDWCY